VSIGCPDGPHKTASAQPPRTLDPCQEVFGCLVWIGQTGFVEAVLSSLYKGHRHPVEIISHCVWLYHGFPLSLREVEEINDDPLEDLRPRRPHTVTHPRPRPRNTQITRSTEPASTEPRPRSDSDRWVIEQEAPGSRSRPQGINSLIQAAKARARGYRNKNKMITIIYLTAAILPLPTLTNPRPASMLSL
jgi:hypothetical protein